MDTNFTWGAPIQEPVKISCDPPKDDFYKARISALEKENLKLRAEIEKRANWYGMGKDAYDAKHQELVEENQRLVDENLRLRTALIREAIRDV
jgi:hypothetical protein